MPSIKKFKRGVYEHNNLFKIKEPIANVGDSEVREITPFRGVIQTQGDIISSDDLNEIQKNSVYFVDTEYSENYGTGVDAYVISNFTNEQNVFSGLKLKFIIPKTNVFDNPILIIDNNRYALKLSGSQEIKAQALKKDSVINVVYNGDVFFTELVTTASEETSGIAKIYKKSDTENDAKKIKKYARENIGNNKEVKEGLNGKDYEREYQNAKTYWENLIEKADHTKFVTMKDLSIILKEILQPANGNEYGIVSYDTIRSVSPKPDLSPYVPFAKGYRDKGNVTEFVRANASDVWTPRHLHMYLENGDYMGAFHLNGGRAYYRVPNRNSGNWCEIMDQFDMIARDQRMDRIDADKSNLWGRANDAWNKAHDAQVNRIYEIRMVGYVEDEINGKGERNGYVLTKVSRNYGESQDHIKIGSRALQFHRNGQWLNAYFA
ncbi:hypothetical protein [Pseudoleptotrichia goodfellowii]|uniref:Uncharacterized protein n=1 Tax=Pseudoleptotrichia goodfellowii TaxID=157692 RepID=A0A510J8H0_9FUSO|nr:hypothetical protein [Pseudoleptotrichia goodfellowii]BBM35467.1 hypothetical protein JCM16774_0380 [Pseudoleptotrichia goodfellowii]